MRESGFAVLFAHSLYGALATRSDAFRNPNLGRVLPNGGFFSCQGHCHTSFATNGFGDGCANGTQPNLGKVTPGQSGY